MVVLPESKRPVATKKLEVPEALIVPVLFRLSIITLLRLRAGVPKVDVMVPGLVLFSVVRVSLKTSIAGPPALVVPVLEIVPVLVKVVVLAIRRRIPLVSPVIEPEFSMFGRSPERSAP